MRLNFLFLKHTFYSEILYIRERDPLVTLKGEVIVSISGRLLNALESLMAFSNFDTQQHNFCAIENDKKINALAKLNESSFQKSS